MPQVSVYITSKLADDFDEPFRFELPDDYGLPRQGEEIALSISRTVGDIYSTEQSEEDDKHTGLAYLRVKRVEWHLEYKADRQTSSGTFHSVTLHCERIPGPNPSSHHREMLGPEGS